MSHVRVAQNAVHDKLSSYCVLEDDVVFHPRAPQMLGHFMREVPDDWGQVYLGGQFLHREPEQVSPWVLRPYNVNRTHAFAISHETIPRFLQHIMNAPDYFNLHTGEEGTIAMDRNCFHIDHQLGRAHERADWKTYVPTWWLAGQEEGSSNISGRVNPRLWWHWRDRGHTLPFFFVEADASQERRELARKYLHPGYNTWGHTLTDIGLIKELSDSDLLAWLRMIAGEAVELWKLPGFEVPTHYPTLPDQVRRVWEPGLMVHDDYLLPLVSDYPFNGFCGGAPHPS
jgi:GR25 family glycosyltransferase involved in LPS biosynthesis